MITKILSVHLTSCIINIIKTYFSCGIDFTIINMNDEIIETLKNISVNPCHSIFIRNNITNENSNFNDAYIITTTDLEKLTIDFKYLSFDIFFNTRARFIVIVKSTKHPLEKIFNVFLQYKILNVILIVNSSSDDVKVYTYFPYEDGACGGYFNRIKMIDNCNHTEKTNYFPNKVPKILGNCTIKIITHSIVPEVVLKPHNIYHDGAIGVDQYVFNVIASVENITLNYSLSKDKEKYGIVFRNNQTVTGLLSYIKDGEADVAVGGLLLIESRANIFDYIWGYNGDTQKIYYPKRKEMKWKMIFKEFSITTWLLILLTLITFTFITNLVIVTLSRRHTRKSQWAPVTLILTFWGYFFLNTNLFLANNKKIRFFIFCWIWFTFFINSFYSTSLYSIITTQESIIPLKTLNSIEAAGYKPCVSIAVRDFLRNSNNKRFFDYVNIKTCNTMEGALLTTAASDNLYAISFNHIYIQKEDLFIDREGHHVLHIVDFVRTYYSNAIYFYRGYPFIRRFQKIVRHTFEAGLIKHHVDSIRLKKGVKPITQTKKFEKLYLGDLKIAFFVLFIGYSLSISVLVMEKSDLISK